MAETATSSDIQAPNLDKGTGAVQPKRDPKLVERDELLARMDEQIVAARKADDDYFLASADVDPRAAALAAQMAKEARGEALDTDRGHRELAQPGGEDDPNDGAASVEPIEDDAATQARAAVRVSTKGEDPLGEYVVRVQGKPMFKTLVDGQERLIPLEAARAQLQKHLAADIRLQQAAETRKQLDARAAAIQKAEEQLRTRSQPPAPAAVDDKTLDTEAVELVRSLVNEPEDKAAARLAKTLKTIRQAPAAPIDANAIVKQAADVAVRTIAERDKDRATREGFETFTKDYPDIASDSDLFALADRKTVAIAEEHPDWSPGKVMLEAGKQTREWLKSLGAPVRSAAPAANGSQPSNRQQRKENLRPMPTARTARPAAAQQAQTSESPQDVLAEIRKSRGQSL